MRCASAPGPTRTREMTIAALAAGKHVLCEARMAMNAAEGRRMLEASRKAPQLIAQLVPAPHTLEVDRQLKTADRRGLRRRRCTRSRCRALSRRASPSRATRCTGGRTSDERQQHPEHGHLVRGDDALAGSGRAGHGHDQDRHAASARTRRRPVARGQGARPRRHPGELQERPGRPPALQLADRAGAAAGGVDLRQRRHAARRGRCQAALDRRAARRQGAEGDRRSRPTSASAGAWKRSS